MPLYGGCGEAPGRLHSQREKQIFSGSSERGRENWRKTEGFAVVQAPVRSHGAWPLLLIQGHLYPIAGEDWGWSVTLKVKATCPSSPYSLHKARCPEHRKYFLGVCKMNDWVT